MKSFNDIQPSKDFIDIYYDYYLEIASQEELKTDIITQQTYYNICRKFDIPIPKPNFPKSKLLKLL
jgi:hypothetical protein